MEKNILIIDDDPQILELLATFLDNNNHTTSTASSGEKGLALARKKEFDLILLDIILPDADGLSILKNLMKITPNARVIMITGGNDVEIAEQCLQNGAVDYITKPFDFEYLRTSIVVNTLNS